MAYDAYPAGSDLQTFLQGANLKKLPANINYGAKMTSAVTRFRRETGREFLGEKKGLTTRRFDPPQLPARFLALGADLCSDNRAGVSIVFFQSDLPGQAQPASVLVQDTDYYVHPFDAQDECKPYNRIEFPSNWPGIYYGPYAPSIRKSLAITGCWAYSWQVPEDVWEGILSLGALLCVPDISLAIGQGLASTKKGDEEDRFAVGRDSGPAIAQATLWQATYQAARDDNKQILYF